ncbi:hypothetical protein [Dyadobacter sandarakinus]|uniref:Uncharacterized protein n=1 Tax=Dyadobacter sandarakinus TaxID=2747268 RepID=A0ABX7IC73_9BACT|nr:hypothetical protein [Dyadobacter sandarakinus]QRR03714.1 hypothetical protein HWI92_23760 [Dyadobacter sandarakinus]
METTPASKASSVPADPDDKYSIGNTVTEVKEAFAPRKSAVGRGIESQIASVLTQTVMRRLPPPLNFVAPLVTEKLIMKYGVEEGRELLLKALYWVKKATDDESAKLITKTSAVL